MMRQQRDAERRWSWTGFLLAMLAAVLWGMAPVATKMALRGFSPEFIGFLRLAGAAVLFRWFAGDGARWFVADVWTCLAGVALGTDFIFYNYGMQRTSASAASLVINVEMVSTIAFAVWLLEERLSRRRAVGSAITLAGVLIVTFARAGIADLADATHTLGNILVMSAGVAWSLFAVAQYRGRLGRTLFHRLTPIFAVAALTTAPMLLRPGALTISGGWTPGVMLCVLVALVTGLVYWAYARAQQLIDVSVLAILLCTIPVFAVGFARVLLGERLTLRLLLGGAVIVGGIVVIAPEEGRAPGGGIIPSSGAVVSGPATPGSPGSRLDSPRNP